MSDCSKAKEKKHKARINEVKALLESNQIDLVKLRKYCSTGCPNEGGTRSLIWKILLKYLPCDKVKWKNTLASQRNTYHDFVRDIILRPGYKNALDDDNVRVAIDHPLNSNPDSEWATYFKDNEILLQIDKDVRRLCPELFFFQKPTEYPLEEMQTYMNASSGNPLELGASANVADGSNKIINKEKIKYESLRKRVAFIQLKSDNVVKNRLGITNVMSGNKRHALSTTVNDDQTEYTLLPDGQEAHWEIVERILFIFAKLNPGQSYVQGMNEVCGPLYYTFATDPDPEWRKHAEADCFWCFTNLMSCDGVRDNFVKLLDNTEWGIGSNMKRLFNLIRIKDNAVYQVLEKQQLKPEFFAFRWLTLLLSQEFELPDVIAIWDFLFADKDLFDLLLHVCCAMIILQRDILLAGDFSTNIKILQNYPIIDVQLILNKAEELRN